MKFNFFNDREDSVFVVKLLAYLYYGDISTRFIPAKSEVKLSIVNKIQNNSGKNKHGKKNRLVFKIYKKKIRKLCF